MKKFYTFLLALCSLFFVACEQLNDTQLPEEPVLTRISDAIMEFEARGGNGSIAYTLENPTIGVYVTASCNADWINGLTSGDKVTFIVEENTSEEYRYATIEVRYGSDCQFEVSVCQKGSNEGGNNGNNNGEDKEYTMTYFEGSYYGTDFSDTYNYAFAISDKPTDEDGHFPENTMAYILDVYSDVPGNGSMPVLPNGTYEFDPIGSCAANTIANNEYTFHLAADGFDYAFEDAIMEVSDGKIELLVALSNGEIHYVEYEGLLNCYDVTSDDGGNDDSGNDDSGDDYYVYSNLTEDYNFNFSGSNVYGYATNYGDFYKIGSNNLYVELYENGTTLNGAYIILDLLTDATATSIVGTYTPYYDSEGYEYLFMEGYVEEDEEGAFLAGSWIATLEDNMVGDGPLAPIYLGGVTIAATNEADVYTVTLDCEDDAGYAISGTYKGVIEYSVAEMNVAPKKVQKHASVVAKRNIKKHDFLARR